MTESTVTDRRVGRPPSKSEKGGGQSAGHESVPEHWDKSLPVPITSNGSAQASAWHPMATAHQDGRPLWLTDGNGNVCEAVWRITRQYGMVKNSVGRFVGKWHEGGFWSVKDFSGTKIPFIPKGWADERNPISPA